MAVERPLENMGSDELFRAAMAPDPEPTPQVEERPSPVEPVVPQAPAAAQTPAEPAAPAPEAPAPEAAIPSWRLKEEAEARRVAEDRARMLEQRLNEVAQHIRQNQKQPDFFDNPDQATQALIARALQPYAEEQRRNMMYLGKMVAESKHGSDVVAKAEDAFLRARENESLDPADYERVVGSPNRYDAVVGWYNRQSTLSVVGNDPNAWFEKQLESKMSDPTFQAKMLEKIRGDAAKRPAATQIPPSLSKATASAVNREEPIGDLSDASLFAFATQGMPGKR